MYNNYLKLKFRTLASASTPGSVEDYLVELFTSLVHFQDQLPHSTKYIALKLLSNDGKKSRELGFIGDGFLGEEGNLRGGDLGFFGASRINKQEL